MDRTLSTLFKSMSISAPSAKMSDFIDTHKDIFNNWDEWPECKTSLEDICSGIFKNFEDFHPRSPCPACTDMEGRHLPHCVVQIGIDNEIKLERQIEKILKTQFSAGPPFASHTPDIRLEDMKLKDDQSDWDALDHHWVKACAKIVQLMGALAWVDKGQPLPVRVQFESAFFDITPEPKTVLLALRNALVVGDPWNVVVTTIRVSKMFKHHEVY